MAGVGEAGPIILFDLQSEPLGDFVAGREVASQVYVPITRLEFGRYNQYGCSVTEMAKLIMDNMSPDSPEEIMAAADALALFASFNVKNITLPVLGPEDDLFHVALPGKSTGEEMTKLSIRKTSEATKKRRDG